MLAGAVSYVTQSDQPKERRDPPPPASDSGASQQPPAGEPPIPADGKFNSVHDVKKVGVRV